ARRIEEHAASRVMGRADCSLREVAAVLRGPFSLPAFPMPLSLQQYGGPVAVDCEGGMPVRRRSGGISCRTGQIPCPNRSLTMLRTVAPTLAALAAICLLSSPALLADDKDAEKTGKSGAAKAAQVAVFTLSGPITETPTPDDPLFGSMGSESLRSLIERMDKAVADKDVKAAVLMLGDTSLGYAQLSEIRAAMDRLKEAGKPVYAHADSLQFGKYLLLSGASRLSVAPQADVWVNGIYGEHVFL